MDKFFFTILRSIAIPIVAFILLRESFLGEANAFLAVTIALTIVNLISSFITLIKILPNTLLLKANKVLTLIFVFILQVVSVIGFWIYYLTNYYV